MDKGSIVKVESGRTSKGEVGRIVATIVRPYGPDNIPETKFCIALTDELVYEHKNGKIFLNPKESAWVWKRNCELFESDE